LGNWIRVCVDGVIYRLRLIKYEISFSEIQTLNVDFSDLTVQIDCVSDLKSIKDSVTSMDSNFSYVSMQADKGNEAQNTLVDFMQNGLDSSLIQINNNTHEEITYGKHGLIAKSYNDFIDEYDPEQLRITHNILAYTDDNWKTVKSALGKHDYYKFDKNGILDNHTGYGLTSDFVTSGIVYGSQMISGDIYSENYSPATGTGAHIDLNNGSFTLADSKIVYDANTNILNLKGVTLDWNTTTSPSISDVDGLDKRLNAMDNKYAEDLSEYEAALKTYIDTSVSDLQSQIDGNITSWFYDYDPTTKNEPASNWLTQDEQIKHEGDLFYNVTTGKAYRYIYDSSTKSHKWVMVTDEDVTQALALAQQAQDTADGKRRVFVITPTVPYDVGDLWLNNSELYVCQTAKTSTGTYDSSDWKVATKYTDDSALNAFIDEDYANALSNIKTQIDGKARSWYQDTDPSSTWDKSEDHEGDLWYDTSESSQVTSIYQDGAWKATSVPKSLFDTIDGKAAIYVSYPSNPSQGDLLIPTNNLSVNGVSYIKGKVYKYDGTSWIEIAYTDDTKANEALDKANNAQTTANSAKSVADNAKTIGDNLVNVLGYDGTKITGTYIYSPVISGGSILVGNKSGTYAQITTDGVLNCAGANITGVINATKGGTIGGFNIGTSAIYNGTSSIASTATGVYVGVDGIRNNNAATRKYVKIQNGTLFANDANITGAITATSGSFTGSITSTSGKIGGFDITSSAIYSSTSSMTSTTPGIYLGKDGIRNYYSSSAYVDICNGKLTANNVDISGKITSSSGKIGGFTISSNSIIGGTWGSSGGVMVCTGTDSAKSIGGSASINGWCFTAGANFGVTKTGALYASSANISGVLTAGAGSSMGGLKTDNNSLFYGTWAAPVPPSIFISSGTGYGNSYTICGRSGKDWVLGSQQSFGVTNKGALYCNSGQIGGWTIGTSGLSSGGSYINTNGTFYFLTGSNNNWCGFLPNSSSVYHFCLGSSTKLQMGSTTLTEAQLKKLLALI
jgi:hypothetical protein